MELGAVGYRPWCAREFRSLFDLLVKDAKDVLNDEYGVEGEETTSQRTTVFKLGSEILYYVGTAKTYQSSPQVKHCSPSLFESM